MSCTTISDKAKSSYILGVGEKGAKNLNLQHKMLEKNSIEQLKKAGLRQGMVVWDVGCGSGEMTEYIASVVGNSGYVYAMDVSEDQIKVAKKRIEDAGYKNVSFVVGDILAINNNNFKKADIVHSRLLLMHVKNANKAIHNMISLLKPSGVVTLEESSMDSMKDSCKNISLEKYYKLLVDYAKLRNTDYNIGRKLPSLCADLNIFSKIEYYVTKFDLSSSNGRHLLLSRFDEVKEKLVDTRLASKEEMDKIKNDIIYYFKNPNCTLYTEQTHLLLSL